MASMASMARSILRCSERGVTVIESKPEEAFLMFEKWQSEGAELLCTSRLIGWAFVLRGKVLGLSRAEVSVGVKDCWVIKIEFGTDDLVFGYSGEGRDALVLALPSRFFRSELEGTVREHRWEMLTFSEVD
jgi:hypothetical protein